MTSLQLYGKTETEVSRLLSCRTPEAVIVASRTEKNKVSLAEHSVIRTVAIDDGGYTEIVL